MNVFERLLVFVDVLRVGIDSVEALAHEFERR
jgi:hypothetical protein